MARRCWKKISMEKLRQIQRYTFKVRPTQNRKWTEDAAHSLLLHVYAGFSLLQVISLKGRSCEAWYVKPQNHSFACISYSREILLKNLRIIGWSLFWFTSYFDGRSSFAHRHVFLYNISGSYSSIRASSHKKTYLWLAPSRSPWCTYFGRSYLDSARAFIGNMWLLW